MNQLNEEQHGYWPMIVDRGDGVKGHYCIGRLVKPGEPYWEYWNKGEWSSAGQVFIGREAAEAQLFAIRDGIGAERTATAMRDACVEKVKAIAGDYRKMRKDNANIIAHHIEGVAQQLESLTLDQVQEKR